MKNIKSILSKILKAWMLFCTFMVSSIVALLIVYNVSIWATLGFDPHFFYIDTCLDLGGVWNYDENICEQSDAYNEWKERTVW